jgi:hypothetical protein
MVPALVDDLGQLEKRTEGLPHGTVDPMGSLRTTSDVHRRMQRVETKAQESRFPIPAEKFRAERVSSDHALSPWEFLDRHRVGHGNPSGHASRNPIGEPRHGDLLVDHDRNPEQCG